MIPRLAYQDLKKWKESANRKPLILRGARQVGKSTLVNEFSKEYDVYLHLNLDNRGDRKLFDDYQDIHELIEHIYVHCRQQRSDGLTLLFIDEIQNSLQAVAMLRYFYEEANHIHVIAAGSLLESLIDNHISFPVGRVQFLALRPLSFFEFLQGTGNDFEVQLILDRKADMAHERLMKLFKDYCVVGGMPEAVAVYSASDMDIMAVNDVYKSLLTSYIDDVEKYARKSTSLRHVIRHILEYGWGMGGETITFERYANSSYKTREMGEAFRTLEKTMLLELAYPVTSAKVPLLPSFTKRPKLFWLDTGLVNYASGMREDIFQATEVQDLWRGRMAEHIVAQEMLAASNDVRSKRFFWVTPKAGNSAEVDFVFQHKSKAIPVEVKSGTNAHLKSLHIYMDDAPHEIAVRVWSKPFRVDEVVTQKGKKFLLFNVPFYYVHCMTELIDEYLK